MVSSMRVLTVSCYLALLLACGGGGFGTMAPAAPATPATGQLTVVGTLAGTPSALQVGGQTLSTTSATVTVNGQPGTAQELQPGVILHGKGTRSGSTIHLESADVRPDLCGPITVIDGAGGTIQLLGRTVTVNALTILVQEETGHTFSAMALADFKVGDLVRVSGSTQTDGSFLATRIERRVPGAHPEAELRGLVSGLDATASTFMIGSITVTYGTAVVRGTLANGLQVEVGGTLSGSTFTASRVAVEHEAEEDHGAAVEARGSLSMLDTTAKTFMLLTYKVDYSAAVVVGTLADGAVVEVEGSFNVTANTILATSVQVKFGHHDGSASDVESKGTLTALSATDLTMTLGGITYWTDAQTVFLRAEAAIAFSDLKVGDRVEVRALSTKTNAAGQAYASRVQDESLH